AATRPAPIVITPKGINRFKVKEEAADIPRAGASPAPTEHGKEVHESAASVCRVMLRFRGIRPQWCRSLILAHALGFTGAGWHIGAWASGTGCCTCLAID